MLIKPTVVSISAIHVHLSNSYVVPLELYNVTCQLHLSKPGRGGGKNYEVMAALVYADAVVAAGVMDRGKNRACESKFLPSGSLANFRAVCKQATER